MKSSIIIFLLLSIVAADPGSKPKAAFEHWKVLMGKYENGKDFLLVFEQQGNLTIKKDNHNYLLHQRKGNIYNIVESKETIRFGENFCEFQKIKYRKKRFTSSFAPGETFIAPIASSEKLREQALKATPPREMKHFLAPVLVNIARLDPKIKFDIRYAGKNNFMGMVFYREAKVFLQRPAAQALVKAHKELEKWGYGIIVFDGYRPWYVTKIFWDATPEHKKKFVANPVRGSRHNRGAAVDVSLYDLNTGKPVPMPSDYDEFFESAYINFPGGSSLERWNRDLLRSVMENHGFSVYKYEWWHFDYKTWRHYPILNIPIGDIPDHSFDGLKYKKE